ncbi:hypothetical protein C8D91_2901 [Marinicella litoralis]|uniref:Uncharacterized protein n=1 Tax=Marinicella litoralis TaxID=644220 RepID=A0A4R6XFB3_9GAMM|nr:hypothetical protein C8D91_2901 [Marinicella litoralis]
MHDLRVSPILSEAEVSGAGRYRVDPQDGVNAENCRKQFLPSNTAHLHDPHGRVKCRIMSGTLSAHVGGRFCVLLTRHTYMTHMDV